MNQFLGSRSGLESAEDKEKEYNILNPNDKALAQTAGRIAPGQAQNPNEIQNQKYKRHFATKTLRKTFNHGFPRIGTYEKKKRGKRDD